MHRGETLEDSSRVILVYVHEPDWNPTVPDVFAGSDWEKHKMYQMEVRAFIGVDGSFDGMVDVLCGTSEKVGDVLGPTLRECRIAITDLPQWLPEVARQRKEVVAGRTRGEKGPWHFGEVRWENWTPD
jgi:hypothetical protein